MPSLFRRSGVYYAQFNDSERSPTQRRLSLRTRDRAHAARLLDRLTEAERAGAWDPWFDPVSDVLKRSGPEAVTLTDAVSRYLSARKGQLRPQTVDGYERALRKLSEHVGGRKLVGRIREHHIRGYLDSVDLAPTTTRTRLAIYGAFFSHCVSAGWVNQSPVSGITKPRIPARLPKAIKADEVDAICEAVADHARDARGPGQLWVIPLYRFGFFTGMRASELARMRWDHVDLDAGVVNVERQKNGRAQTVPLAPSAVAVLEGMERLPVLGGYVFGSPLTRNRKRNARTMAINFSRDFRRYRDAAGIKRPLTFHSLRHGFATAIARAGKSAWVVQAACRHSSVKVSQVYVSLANREVQAELRDVFG